MSAEVRRENDQCSEVWEFGWYRADFFVLEYKRINKAAQTQEYWSSGRGSTMTTAELVDQHLPADVVEEARQKMIKYYQQVDLTVFDNESRFASRWGIRHGEKPQQKD